MSGPDTYAAGWASWAAAPFGSEGRFVFKQFNQQFNNSIN